MERGRWREAVEIDFLDADLLCTTDRDLETWHRRDRWVEVDLDGAWGSLRAMGAAVPDRYPETVVLGQGGHDDPWVVDRIEVRVEGPKRVRVRVWNGGELTEHTIRGRYLLSWE